MLFAACRKRELIAAVQAYDKPLNAKVGEIADSYAFKQHLEHLARQGGGIRPAVLATICSEVPLRHVLAAATFWIWVKPACSQRRLLCMQAL